MSNKEISKAYKTYKEAEQDKYHQEAERDGLVNCGKVFKARDGFYYFYMYWK